MILKPAFFNLLILAALACAITSCDPPPEDNPARLGEYLKYSIDGVNYSLTSSDSIEFVSAPGLEENSSVPDLVFFVHYVTAQLEHKRPDGSATYESTILHFRQRYARSAAFNDPGRNNSFRLRPENFESLFAPGLWTWYRHGCQDSTQQNELSFFTNFTIRNRSEWSSAAGASCSDPGSDQTGSWLEITGSEPAEHPEFGEGLLITGNFTGRIYTAFGDQLPVENGQFRLFVRR